MKTKDIIEGLLYISPNREFLREAFDICHITNYKERNYTPIEHSENSFLNYFKKPNIICVIEKRIHVYIIGSPKTTGKVTNRTQFYMFDVEGNHTYMYIMTKSGIVNFFKNQVYNSYREFMSDTYTQRIFYIPFEENKTKTKSSEEYEFNIINDMDLSKEKEGRKINMFVFNRPNNAGNMLRTSEWINDEDIHSPGFTNSVKTNAGKIMVEILKEVN